MNILQRLAARVILGDVTKALYDLHPELLDRQPIMRLWSDEAATGAGFQDAARDYEGHVWVNKAVSVIADNIAPLRVRVVKGPEAEEVQGHSLTELFMRVNDTLPGVELWRQWVINMLLGGECGFELVKNGRGDYAEVWPRQSSVIQIRVDRTRRRYLGLLGYTIDDGLADPYKLEPDQFLFFRFYNPRNPWRGLAPITAVRISIRIDEYSQAWARQFFKTGARPDFAVIAPEGLTEREKDAIMARLSEKHGGLENWHKPIVLEQGVTDIKPFSYPPKDIEWLKQREVAREEIGAIFGVPDEIMGWGRDTYENFGQALRVLWAVKVLPFVQMRDTAMTEFFRRVKVLAPTERVDTDLSGVVALQPDMAALTEQAQRLFGMGVPLNIINAVLGLRLGDIEGGDVGYLPLNLIPATGKPPAGDDKSLAAPVTKETEEPRYPFGSDVHKAMWLLHKARTDARERGMKRLVKKLFQAEQDDVSIAIRAADSVNVLDVVQLYDRARWQKEWIDVLHPYVLDTVAEAGQNAREQVSLVGRAKADLIGDFDISNPLVVQAVEEVMWRFTGELTDTTVNELQKLLEKAVGEGWTIPQLSDELALLYSGFKEPRSETIARTETNKAYNLGTQWGYIQEGVEKRGWLSALDAATRTPPKSNFDHVSAHGEEQPFDKPFLLTGEAMDFPGDPNGSAGNIVNCRCALYPVVEV